MHLEDQNNCSLLTRWEAWVQVLATWKSEKCLSIWMHHEDAISSPQVIKKPSARQKCPTWAVDTLPDVADCSFDVIILRNFSGLSIVLIKRFELSAPFIGCENSSLHIMFHLLHHAELILMAKPKSMEFELPEFPRWQGHELPSQWGPQISTECILAPVVEPLIVGSNESELAYGMQASKMVRLTSNIAWSLMENHFVISRYGPSTRPSDQAKLQEARSSRWITLAEIFLHGPSKAFLAALTATSMSSSSPSDTWQISFPVLHNERPQCQWLLTYPFEKVKKLVEASCKISQGF